MLLEQLIIVIPTLLISFLIFLVTIIIPCAKESRNTVLRLDKKLTETKISPPSELKLNPFINNATTMNIVKKILSEFCNRSISKDCETIKKWAIVDIYCDSVGLQTQHEHKTLLRLNENFRKLESEEEIKMFAQAIILHFETILKTIIEQEKSKSSFSVHCDSPYFSGRTYSISIKIDVRIVNENYNPPKKKEWF